MKRDKQLNKYCKNNNIILFRITDEKLKKNTDKQLIAMIKGLL